MVPVIGRPAERKFRKVPCADHHTVGAVGHVHQDLGALPRLCVLKGDILSGGIVPDVCAMQVDRRFDVNLMERDPQPLTELFRIALGAGGGAETGHCDRDHIGMWAAQQVERAYRDQQGESGVQPP